MNAGNPPAASNQPAGSESSAVPTATNKAAFDAAKNVVMPFGKKYKYRTIDQIAQTDEGLKWLDWVRGAGIARSQIVCDALDVYLTDPSIARELKTAIERADARSHSRNNADRERLNEYGM